MALPQLLVCAGHCQDPKTCKAMICIYIYVHIHVVGWFFQKMGVNFHHAKMMAMSTSRIASCWGQLCYRFRAHRQRPCAIREVLGQIQLLTPCLKKKKHHPKKWGAKQTLIHFKSLSMVVSVSSWYPQSSSMSRWWGFSMKSTNQTKHVVGVPP